MIIEFFGGERYWDLVDVRDARVRAVQTGGVVTDAWLEDSSKAKLTLNLDPILRDGVLAPGTKFTLNQRVIEWLGQQTPIRFFSPPTGLS